MEIILASNSPRRKELLDLAKIKYNVIPANINETLNNNLPVTKQIEDIAYQKVKHIKEKINNQIILGADTVVLIDNKILGKPHSKEHAKQMIELLSNKTHQVITGCCIYNNKKDEYILFYEVTDVTFYEIPEEEIIKYIENPSIYDKAGAYAIQEDAAVFVKKINGDYYNIMGLPIAKVYHELKKINV